MNIVDLDKLCERFWDGNFMEIHKNDIPSIPSAFEKMTNGEVIQALFPNISVYEHGSIYSVNNEYNFNATWWNTPYQKVVKKNEIQKETRNS